jgi:hypothetical protein
MPRAAVLPRDAPGALELVTAPALDLLRALDHGLDPEQGPDKGLLDKLTGARAEMHALRRRGTLGLTVALMDVTVLDVHEGLLAGKAGELFLVSWILTGNGRTAEFRSHRFPGVRAGERLPLGEGGMLLGYLTDPRWFVDMHALVMESDADLRTIADTVERAKQEAGWTDMIQTLAAVDKFEAAHVTRAVNVIARLADLAVGLLKTNGADHVATIHDFYLEHQAFGTGRHPESGLARFQDVEAAYTFELSVAS